MWLNNKPSTSCNCHLLLANGSYALALGRDTKPGHHGLVRPDSRRQNLFFPTCHLALDSEPRGRRYVKNMIYNKNHLYSRAIHCPASTEMHYVNGSYLRACMKLWIVQKIRFSLHESGWTKAWCPCLVSRPSAKA